MAKTSIEWCDYTLNPVVGCSKCSPGCLNCYAERFAARLAKNPATAAKYAGVVDDNGKWTGKLSFEGWGCIDILPTYPPKRIFLGSMTDIFHEHMDFMDFDTLCDYMEFLWPQHTFLLLTKRPKRAKEFIEERSLSKNVWLGVTVCNQEEADEKIPTLLETPAAKHFISVEPMLSEINLMPHIFSEPTGKFRTKNGKRQMECVRPLDGGISWVICGGETGPGARPMHPDWARSLRDQCKDAAVPFFFKRMSGRHETPDDLKIREFPEG